MDNYSENSVSFLKLPEPNKVFQRPGGTIALPQQVLPIELFKWRPLKLRPLTAPVTTFLSSGTTYADRSQSHFSDEGLALYKKQALLAFQAMMNELHPDGVEAFQGLSLIPPPTEWEQSSLATMISWFTAQWGWQYIRSIHDVPCEGNTQPILVFATAFQLVDAYDRGLRTLLPPHSLVIETGGTKGKTRSVNRTELYHMISEMFGVPEQRIVSEYGMCELACQAYDWVPLLESKRPLNKRVFRFPQWTQLTVHQGGEQYATSGEGALVIHDPLRVDLQSPIRTQDFVALNADQSFQLLGRVPAAPLKGCSLAFEPKSLASIAIKPRVPQYASLPADMEQRQQRIATALDRFLADEKVIAQLSRELYSRQLAEYALADVRRSLPTTPEAWLQAAHTAAGDGKVPERWLMLMPSTHSLAIFYPTVMAYILNLTCSIKRGRPQGSLEELWLKALLQLAPTQFIDLGTTFRLDAATFPHDVDALMVFGSDETISALQAISPVPIQGFGHTLAIDVVDGQQPIDWPAIFRDVFSLGQQGCLSSRLVIFTQATLNPEMQQQAQAALTDFIKDFCIPTLYQVALDQEQVERRVLHEAETCYLRQALISWHAASSWEDVPGLLAKRPFSLPIVTMSQRFCVNEMQEKIHTHLPSVKVVASNVGNQDGKQNIQLTKLGALNAPAWDGRHLQMPLFALS